MTKNKRRKVLYYESPVTGYNPFITHEERLKQNELERGKTGWFHTWTQESERDSKSDAILIVSNGIIETEDGALITLPHNLFKFVQGDE